MTERLQADLTRCTATVFVGDDRIGGWVETCELPAGHDGEHAVPRTGCDPVASLRWEGSYQ